MVNGQRRTDEHANAAAGGLHDKLRSHGVSVRRHVTAIWMLAACTRCVESCSDIRRLIGQPPRSRRRALQGRLRWSRSAEPPPAADPRPPSPDRRIVSVWFLNTTQNERVNNSTSPARDFSSNRMEVSPSGRGSPSSKPSAKSLISLSSITPSPTVKASSLAGSRESFQPHIQPVAIPANTSLALAATATNGPWPDLTALPFVPGSFEPASLVKKNLWNSRSTRGSVRLSLVTLTTPSTTLASSIASSKSCDAPIPTPQFKPKN